MTNKFESEYWHSKVTNKIESEYLYSKVTNNIQSAYFSSIFKSLKMEKNIHLNKNKTQKIVNSHKNRAIAI